MSNLSEQAEEVPQDQGASCGPGSRASTEPASGFGPTGFDPSRGDAPDPDCEYCFGTGSVETGGDEAHTAFSVACICTAPPMRTCTCVKGDPDPGCVDHGDGSTWELHESDESIPDGWLSDGSWAP